MTAPCTTRRQIPPLFRPHGRLAPPTNRPVRNNDTADTYTSATPFHALPSFSLRLAALTGFVSFGLRPDFLPPFWQVFTVNLLVSLIVLSSSLSAPSQVRAYPSQSLPRCQCNSQPPCARRTFRNALLCQYGF